LIILADSGSARRWAIGLWLQEFGFKVLESDLAPNLQEDLERGINDVRAA